MLYTEKRSPLVLALAVCLMFGFTSPVLHLKESGDLSTPNQDQDAVITANIFSHIYEDSLWGEYSTSAPFFSGVGSHDLEIVGLYVSAVRSFIANIFPEPPDAVDLGCGDFNIGRQIRNTTDQYIACDIVSAVIDYNRLMHTDENVDFRVLDMVSEELPAGDIVFVRQVLQHLRNDQISRLLPKLRRYKWAIVTEHIPFEDNFVPNLDIETGYLIRLNGKESGVVLTEAPFNLGHYQATILCEASEGAAFERGGRIKTIAYQLQQT